MPCEEAHIALLSYTPLFGRDAPAFAQTVSLADRGGCDVFLLLAYSLKISRASTSHIVTLLILRVEVFWCRHILILKNLYLVLSMRLLKRTDTGKFVLTKDFNSKHEYPVYAVLSHTWGKEGQEVTFSDILNGTGKRKGGYQKITFCADQAEQDGIRYFWYYSPGAAYFVCGPEYAFCDVT